MDFYFRQGKSISSEVRRIAEWQLQAGLDDLTLRKPDLHTAIHEFRKRCKRLRALFRIIRPSFPSHYRSCNKILRDLARDLSYVRDAQALVEALDRLEEAGDGAGSFPATRAYLIQRREAAAGGEASLHRRLETMVPNIRSLLESVPKWKIEADGFECVSDGLARTYSRARKARKRCRAKATAHNFHEWRKRVKYHWHHALLLSRTCPTFMHPHRLLAEQLGELLGHDHDYSVLSERLAGVEADEPFRDERKSVCKLIGRQQRKLRRKALEMGGFLQVESTEALVKRWGGYHSEWRDL